MIVLIGSQKGGCGKSTIATNICATLSQRGHDVVLVDSDRQSTAAIWAMDRSKNNSLPVVHCVQKYGNIRDTLLDLNKRYEYVIVDAAGRDSRELRTGMIAADSLVVPFRPSQPDLDTLPNLQTIIVQAKDLNPKLLVQGLITMAPTNHVVHEDNEAREYLMDFPEIQLLSTIIKDRKVYRDMISDGMGVSESKNMKAVQEMNSFINEIFNG